MSLKNMHAFATTFDIQVKKIKEQLEGLQRHNVGLLNFTSAQKKLRRQTVG